MNATIQATIEQLTQEISIRQEIIASLRKLFGEAPAQAPVPGKQQLPARQVSPFPAIKIKPAEMNGHKAARGLQDRIMEVLPVCVSPFDGALVQAALGDRSITVQQVQNALRHAAKIGLLRIVMQGKPGFPAKYELPKAKAAKRAELSVVKPSSNGQVNGLELERKLKAACEQRDAARTAGRETVAEMFQEEIDKLENQLASL